MIWYHHLCCGTIEVVGGGGVVVVVGAIIVPPPFMRLMYDKHCVGCSLFVHLVGGASCDIQVLVSGHHTPLCSVQGSQASYITHGSDVGNFAQNSAFVGYMKRGLQYD